MTLNRSPTGSASPLHSLITRITVCTVVLAFKAYLATAPVWSGPVTVRGLEHLENVLKGSEGLLKVDESNTNEGGARRPRRRGIITSKWFAEIDEDEDSWSTD